MPIFWKYLLRSYLRVFVLSVCGFISILLVTRLKEIAHFASLASSVKNIFLFTFYQIPQILPIAIPISCLISSILLFQRLSKNYELTALRTCGSLSLATLFAPLLFVSGLFFFMNFLLCSEITPHCRSASKEMVYKQTITNPLLLLQKKKLLRVKNIYADIKNLEANSSAKNVILLSYNGSSKRLNLILADHLQVNYPLLQGKNVTLISSFPSRYKEAPDSILMENQALLQTQANMLTQWLQGSNKTSHLPYLPLRALIEKESSSSETPCFNKHKESVIAEIFRRFSLSFSAFSFTFLGMSFGIEIGRNSSKKKIIFAASLALFILISFMTGKALKHYPFASVAVYLLPQGALLLISLWKVHKISQGIE